MPGPDQIKNLPWVSFDHEQLYALGVSSVFTYVSGRGLAVLPTSRVVLPVDRHSPATRKRRHEASDMILQTGGNVLRAGGVCYWKCSQLYHPVHAVHLQRASERARTYSEVRAGYGASVLPCCAGETEGGRDASCPGGRPAPSAESWTLIFWRLDRSVGYSCRH